MYDSLLYRIIPDENKSSLVFANNILFENARQMELSYDGKKEIYFQNELFNMDSKSRNNFATLRNINSDSVNFKFTYRNLESYNIPIKLEKNKINFFDIKQTNTDSIPDLRNKLITYKAKIKNWKEIWTWVDISSLEYDIKTNINSNGEFEFNRILKDASAFYIDGCVDERFYKIDLNATNNTIIDLQKYKSNIANIIINKHSQINNKNCVVQGVVADKEGRYLKNLKDIKIKFIGKKSYETNIDYFGSFSINDIEPGDYSINCLHSKLNYNFDNTKITLKNGVNSLYLPSLIKNSYDIMKVGTQRGEESKPNCASFNIKLRVLDTNLYFEEIFKNMDGDSFWDKYYELKRAYGAAPAFYTSLCDYLYKKNENEKALKIISNLAELNTDDVKLLNLLEMNLEKINKTEYAKKTIEYLMEINEYWIWNYSSLAFLDENDGNYSQAAKNYNYVLQQFAGIALYPCLELTHALKKLKSDEVINYDKKYLIDVPLDLKIDLKLSNYNSCYLTVTNPYGEQVNDDRCYWYNASPTLEGGFNSWGENESFIQKNTRPGKYKIELKYLRDRTQKAYKIPLMAHVRIYTHYNTDKEEYRDVYVNLEKEGETYFVGEVEFKGDEK